MNDEESLKTADIYTEDKKYNDESTEYMNIDEDATNEHLIQKQDLNLEESRYSKLYRQVASLVFMTSVDLVSFNAIQSFLPLFLLEKFPNSTPAEIGRNSGLIIGIFFVARCISTMIFGALSDHFGRKYFIVFSLCVACICTVVFPFMNSVWLLVLLRAAQGFLSSTIELCKASLVDVTTNEWLPSSIRSVLFSYIVAVTTAIRATATGLGGIIVGVMLTDGSGISKQDSFIITCSIAGGVVFLGMLVAIFMDETKKKHVSVEQHQEEELQQQENVMESLKSILYDRVNFTLIFMFFMGSLSNAASNMVWVLITQEKIKYGGLGMSPLLTGVIFLLYGLMCFLVQSTTFKPVLERIGLLATYKIGSIFQIGQCCMLAVIIYSNGLLVNSDARLPVVWVLIVAFTGMVGVGFTGASIAQTMIVNVTHHSRAKGMVQGVNGCADTLGRAVGPIMFGFIYGMFVKMSHMSTIPVVCCLVVTYGIGLILSMTLKSEVVDNK
ncbi:tetracycline resistance protein [Acrasis kona]|uniref:Tetracycline resistance protein n=1 Tax=Acrasis kona TaxID=1008807 RepID=A0AAW2ZI54_9EUKA